MPEIVHVLREEDLTRRGTAVGPDLTPYLDILDTIRDQGGVGAQLRLDEGESQRTVKRRMSIAAKERGLQLVWRKPQDGQLKFVLAGPGQPVPGSRTRRSPAERQDEQTAVEAIMTEDVAELTGTTAAAEQSAESVPPAASAPRRGRGRRPAGDASP